MEGVGCSYQEATGGTEKFCISALIFHSQRLPLDSNALLYVITCFANYLFIYLKINNLLISVCCRLTLKHLLDVAQEKKNEPDPSDLNNDILLQ